MKRRIFDTAQGVTFKISYFTINTLMFNVAIQINMHLIVSIIMVCVSGPLEIIVSGAPVHSIWNSIRFSIQHCISLYVFRMDNEGEMAQDK